MRLDPLAIEDGIQLLNSGARQLHRDEAAQLVERLGGLPLALELVKAFLNYRRDVTVRQVLTEMMESGEIGVLRGFADIYHDELPSGHEIDIARTFEMGWQLAPTAGKEILRVMAELAPFPVPRPLLRKIAGFAALAGLKDDLAEGLSELSRLSLVEFDSRNDPVIHRLIHAFVRYRNEIDQASPVRADRGGSAGGDERGQFEPRCGCAPETGSADSACGGDRIELAYEIR